MNLKYFFMLMMAQQKVLEKMDLKDRFTLVSDSFQNHRPLVFCLENLQNNTMMKVTDS